MPLWDYKSPQQVQPISRPTVPKTMIGFHIPSSRLCRAQRKAMHMSIDPDHSQGAARVGRGPAMIIESSDQVPRATLLKRFPVSRNFGVTPESRIGRGKSWLALAGATRIKTFEVYRHDPDLGENPRIDTFEVDIDDCGPMVLCPKALNPGKAIAETKKLVIERQG